MAERKGMFYGWVILPAAWILYGFGISPAYYSGGQFAPALMEDLDLSAAQWGIIFGAFTFIFSAVAPVSAYLMSRFSIRLTMTLGAAMSSAGAFYMSRADSFLDCIIGLVVLLGLGIGLSTILPAQTLGQNWFLKYRALSIAVILTAGGVVGAAVPYVAKWILENGTWNDGWLVISVISAVLAVIAFLLVRDRPEDIGQFRDGADEDPLPPAQSASAVEAVAGEWTAGQAIRTPQFAMMILCGLAYSQPWGIVVAHGKLHLDNIGMDAGVIASMFALMIFISIFGRISASLGDLVTPKKVLGAALFIEALGVAGLIIAKTPAIGYISVVFLGIGYGAGYVSISVVFSDFFGRRAFAGTTGTRFLIGGTIGAFTPFIAGYIADNTDSYNIAFAGLVILCVVGAVTAFLCPRPGSPPVPGGRAA